MSLNALLRNLQTKYDNATQEINKLTAMNKELMEKFKKIAKIKDIAEDILAIFGEDLSREDIQRMKDSSVNWEQVKKILGPDQIVERDPIKYIKDLKDSQLRVVDIEVREKALNDIMTLHAKKDLDALIKAISALKADEDLINPRFCRICCYNEFNKVLMCGHAFCQDCIKQLIKRDSDGSQYVMCPSCRDISPLRFDKNHIRSLYI